MNIDQLVLEFYGTEKYNQWKLGNFEPDFEMLHQKKSAKLPTHNVSIEDATKAMRNYMGSANEVKQNDFDSSMRIEFKGKDSKLNESYSI